VYVASEACTGHAYRPHKIVFACGDGGLWATNISYRYYGGKTAAATATLHAHSCEPNCAQSEFRSFAGTFVLADVVRCDDGRLYYARARYRFTHGNPYAAASGTANIEPFAHCSAVLG
jgi:hypothetical protein